MYDNWNEKNLQELINDQIEENLNLEYKSADSIGKSEGKKKEISKDVSSMANSAGGTIIYGIKEYDEESKRHLPEKVNPIKRSMYSKEWLEQIINSNIYPRIQNIIINSISISTSNDDVVYRVKIPQSDTAHQANDRMYYKRFNFESVPMYDYEIKDIINRVKNPIITLKFFIEVETYEVKPLSNLPFKLSHQTGINEPEYNTDTNLIVYGFNDGKVLANYVNCFLEVPEKILLRKDYDDKIIKNNISYVRLYCDNTKRDVVGSGGDSIIGFYSKYGPSRYEPMLPKTNLKLRTELLSNEINFGDLKLYWTINADNSEPINGEINLSSIEIKEIKKEQ